MPNWCVGTLKVRGKIEDLKRFVLEGLQPVDFLGEQKPALTLDKYGYCEHDGNCWIENTHRGFVLNIYLELDDEGENDTQVIGLNSKFAWSIDAKQLQETCKKYNVDMKIYAFERGMEFNQDIEIVNGEIIKDDKITFDDYEWECINPIIGG